MSDTKTKALFGTAGCCEDFFDSGNKSALTAPKWLADNGLDCFEYQCGRGVKISDDAAYDLGDSARQFGIVLSVHSPYYISLSSVDEEKRRNSVDYILATLNAAKCMGADRIVVHSGSCGKITRREALRLATETLTWAIDAADAAGFGNIHICPETMGKVKQLGTVDEVIALCSIDDRLIPTVDFGHVNAMTLGGLKTKEDFENIFDKIQNKLGRERAHAFHAHFSRIEYTNAGEKKHRTYAETEFEPDFYPLAQVMAKLGVSRGMVVYGKDSLDEISMCAPTAVCEIKDGWFQSYELTPEQFGYERCDKSQLTGGSPQENAEITKAILEGREKGAKRQAVCLNAGAALYITGKAETIEQGVRMAESLIDDGSALRKLEEFITESNR